MKFRSAGLAALVGLGLAIAPVSQAAAAPKTYPVQVSLIGNPCPKVAGVTTKLTAWNVTIANQRTPLGQQFWAGKQSKKTFDVPERYRGNVYVVVHTTCGRGALQTLKGSVGDTCATIPVTATKRKPATITVDINGLEMGMSMGVLECR